MTLFNPTIRILYSSSLLTKRKKQPSPSLLLSLTCYVPVYSSTVNELKQKLLDQREKQIIIEDLLAMIFKWLNSTDNPLVDDQKHQKQIDKYQSHTQMQLGDIIMVGSRYYQLVDHGFRQRDESKFIG